MPVAAYLCDYQKQAVEMVLAAFQATDVSYNDNFPESIK